MRCWQDVQLLLRALRCCKVAMGDPSCSRFVDLGAARWCMLLSHSVTVAGCLFLTILVCNEVVNGLSWDAQGKRYTQQRFSAIVTLHRSHQAASGCVCVSPSASSSSMSSCCSVQGKCSSSQQIVTALSSCSQRSSSIS